MTVFVDVMDKNTVDISQRHHRGVRKVDATPQVPTSPREIPSRFRIRSPHLEPFPVYK